MGIQAQTELISLPLFFGVLGLLIGWLAVLVQVRRRPMAAVDRTQRQRLTTAGLAYGLAAGFALFGIVRAYAHDWVLPVAGLLAAVIIYRLVGARRSRSGVLYPVSAVLGAITGLLWLAIIGR